MPTRLLRDWTDSFAVDALDAHAERFFVRLMMKADDFGRFHADPRLLRSMCFPLKGDVRDTDISRWLAACEKAGLLRCYADHRGRSLLEIVNFGQRQRTDSKFPSPDRCQHLAVICPSNDGLGEGEGEGEGEGATPKAPTDPHTPDAGRCRFMPHGWKKWPMNRQKRERVIANSPGMIRVGSWFGRRESTLWTVFEAGLLVNLRPAEDELELLECYYLADLPSESDYRRRDLGTLLNNWTGELDRAREWKRRIA